MAGVRVSNAAWPHSATNVINGARIGPYRDSSGNLWVVTFNSSTTINAYKSTDNGATWPGGISATTGITASAATIADTAYDSSAQRIYCVYQTSATSALRILYFDLVGGTASMLTTSDGPVPTNDVNGLPACYLCRRTDGSFVVVYQGPTGGTKSYRQMYYVTCTSAGVWGTATLAYSLSASSVHVDTKSAVVGASNRIHMLAATSGGVLAHRSLDSTNVLDTAGNVVATGATDTGYYSIFYDATLARVVTHNAGRAYRSPSAASQAWTADTNTFGTDVTTSPDAFAYDTAGTRLYVFYRDSTTTDVFSNSAASTTWGTAALLDVATAPAGISSVASANRIDVAYNDTGVYYDFYSLGGAPAPQRTLMGVGA